MTFHPDNISPFAPRRARLRQQFAASHDLLDVAEVMRLQAKELRALATELDQRANEIDPTVPGDPTETDLTLGG